MFKRSGKTFFILSLVGVLVIVFLYQRANRSYADYFFSKVVAFDGYDKVFESRKWFSGAAYGCTYAIVSLKPDAQETPPSTWQTRGKWMNTPIKDNSLPDAVTDCEHLWSLQTRELIHAALATEGSYYWWDEDQSPDTRILDIYSKKHHIAVHIRYGD